jgi:hypothetical protein
VTMEVLLPVRRVRWSQTGLAGFHASSETTRCGLCAPIVNAQGDRRAIRAGWAFTSARTFGYSISAEEGWSATVSTEWTRRDLGADGDAASAAIDLRAYRRTVPRHGVVAMRFAAASAWGDDPVRRTFSAAGSGPQPAGFRFGLDAIGLLRGFDPSDVTGRHAATINIDWRFPLARIQRGVGTLPFFVRHLHAAVFVDGGQAWNTAFDPGDARLSVGAELSMDAVLGFTLPITLTTGAAWRHDGASVARGIVGFTRIGRAF